MKFIDEATIQIRSGKGGAGCTHFHREKFVARGGPDGGDGGSGGSIIALASENVQTLLDFKFKPLWQAANGRPGEKNNKRGADGEDIILQLPVGTQIFDEETSELLHDLSHANQSVKLLEGGRGGKGNAFFKSATNQTPKHSQPGEEGAEARLKLNLKLVADIGIIGLPNAGKSSFISKVSAAKPKIADYPFTTLVPNLGLVKGQNKSFVLADIPGLIPGAHKGKGLGLQFLKHVERTRCLLFLIDPLSINEEGSLISTKEVYKSLRHELESFSPEIAERPKLIAISKSDLISEEQRQEIQKLFQEQNLFFISSLSGENLSDLLLELEKLT